MEQARDAAFTTLVFAELLRAFGARSATLTIWQLGLFSNLRLFLVVALGFLLQYGIHHIPGLQTLFGINAMTLTQCVIWAAVGSIPFIVLELRKVIRRGQN